MAQITESKVQDEHGIGEEKLNDPETRPVQGGVGHMPFGLNETYRSITFTFAREDTSLVLFKSGCLIVFVDAVIGESVWIPQTSH